jgi:hypothetical protein
MATSVIEGRLFAVGGGPPPWGEAVARVEEYDPVTGTWAARASMPTPGGMAGNNCVVDGLLFAVGGTLTDWSTHGAVQVYEPERSHLLGSPLGQLPAVAGHAVDLPITVVLKPSGDGTFPELRVDLSRVNGADAVTLDHQGNGRYEGRMGVNIPVNSHLQLPLWMVTPGQRPRYLTSIQLRVWPAGNLPILAEGLAAGWSTTTSGFEHIILAQSEVVCTGSTACALTTKRSRSTGWTLVLQPSRPIGPFGYELHLAVHSGSLSLTNYDRLRLKLEGGTEILDLLDGDMVDWSRRTRVTFAVRRFTTILSASAGTMELRFLTKQMILMTNLLNDYLLRVPRDCWQQLAQCLRNNPRLSSEPSTKRKGLGESKTPRRHEQNLTRPYRSAIYPIHASPPERPELPDPEP